MSAYSAKKDYNLYLYYKSNAISEGRACKMDKIKIGAQIREARLLKKFTQEVLSEKADIGVTYLSDIERGVKFPSLTIFIKIVEALDVSADFILRGTIESGKEFIYDDLTKKLEKLSPKQRQCVSDIIDAYLKTL